MNVLIVDDNPVNLAVMERLVRRVDATVALTFDRAETALAWCRDNEADLVIVDYMMPVMNGIDFIRLFREMPGNRELPVLMVTAEHAREVRHAALRGGATDFLTKPVDHEEFCARTRNMLTLRAAQKRLAERAQSLEEAVAAATARLRVNERETLDCLARAAEYRDPETGAHVSRMALYSHLIARRLGLPEDEAELLLRAAPLHDVGKLGTPDHILLKPGRLTPDEFEVMKRHATMGWEILRGHSSPVLQAGAAIALSHHEKWDGSGYPGGLAGADIPLFGRIVAVADVFDALTSERPYKKAWPVEQAREHLQAGAGAHFDPRCVEVFLSAWDEVMTIRAAHAD